MVGLAVGRAFALRGHAVIVAEAEEAFGTGVSARSSEVIHGGMYYPSGSARARHCVEGAEKLYNFCANHGVPHRACGKLIVAGDDAEADTIAAIRQQGEANGVRGLELLDAAAAKRLEPNLACTLALHAPHTGIVDSHALMLALLGVIEDHGGALALRTPVERLSRRDGQWHAAFGGSEPVELAFDAVVNAASFGAPALAARTEGYPAERVPVLRLARGNYFGCTGKPAFSRLIYPAPRIDGGLGIHLTLDLAGRTRFGPDVEWVEGFDYRVDPAARIVSTARSAATGRACRTGALPGLCRPAPQAHRPGRDGGGLSDRRTGGARAARDRPPVRDREPGADLEPVARRGGGRAARRLRLRTAGAAPGARGSRSGRR